LFICNNVVCHRSNPDTTAQQSKLQSALSEAMTELQ